MFVVEPPISQHRQWVLLLVVPLICRARLTRYAWTPMVLAGPPAGVIIIADVTQKNHFGPWLLWLFVSNDDHNLPTSSESVSFLSLSSSQDSPTGFGYLLLKQGRRFLLTCSSNRAWSESRLHEYTALDSKQAIARLNNTPDRRVFTGICIVYRLHCFGSARNLITKLLTVVP